MRHLRRTGQARRRDLARTLYYVWRYKLGLLDIERAVAVSLGWIRGRDEAAVRADCQSWYERIVRRYLRPAMVATVEAHRRAGHLPVILTSATRYLAEPVAADLGHATRHRRSGRVRADGEPTHAGPDRTQARADRPARHAGERAGGRRAALALPDARAAAGSRAPAGCARAALAPGSARARSPVHRASRAPVAAPPPGGGGGWRPSTRICVGSRRRAWRPRSRFWAESCSTTRSSTASS